MKIQEKTKKGFSTMIVAKPKKENSIRTKILDYLKKYPKKSYSEVDVALGIKTSSAHLVQMVQKRLLIREFGKNGFYLYSVNQNNPKVLLLTQENKKEEQYVSFKETTPEKEKTEMNNVASNNLKNEEQDLTNKTNELKENIQNQKKELHEIHQQIVELKNVYMKKQEYNKLLQEHEELKKQIGDARKNLEEIKRNILVNDKK